MTKAKSPFRLAIVGAGMAADLHYRAVAANADRGVELTAVAHYKPSHFEGISDRFGVPCTHYEDVLARADVDAVVLATPSGQHAEQAVAAAEAGKHVLVEKPMALRRCGADRMIQACRQAGVRLGVVFQRRAEPLFQKIHRAAVQKQDFGRLTLGSLTLPYHRGGAYYEQAAWRGTWAQDGGGVLMNQGIHLVDLLIWYLGDLTDVTARAATLERSVEVEDTLVATLKFESGALATITATTTARPGFPHRLALFGTAGGLELEGEAVRRWDFADSEGAQEEPPVLSERPSEAGAGGAPGAIEEESHARLLADFIDAVREDRPPLVDGKEGRRSLEAVLSIYEAASLACAS